MKRQWVIILSVVFCTHLAFADDRLVFANFDTILQVQGMNDNPPAQEPTQFQTANRIMVKAALGLDKVALGRYDKHIEKTTELYQGKDFHYLMLELSGPDELATVLAALQHHPDIFLVQPDVLQLRSESEATGFSPFAPRETLQPGEPSPLNVYAPADPAKAVRIAIIDDGFDLNHPEFRHTKIAFQYDTEAQSLDAAPKIPLDSHGTKLAGVLFAEKNGNRVEGMVPEAELIAIRQPNTWTSQTLLAFQVARLAGADIINCSWHSRRLLEPIADVVKDLAENGRGGKGIAVVFAAGNEGVSITPYLHEAAIPEAVVVGALDKKGKRARYSNAGDSVDVYFAGYPQLSTANNGGFAPISGTSLAAAKASGFIAKLLRDDPTLSLQVIEQRLTAKWSLSDQSL